MLAKLHILKVRTLYQNLKNKSTAEKACPLGERPQFHLLLHLDQLFDLERAFLLYTAAGSDTDQDGKRSIPAPRSLT